MNFFDTVGGREFCDSIIHNLNKIAKELARANDLKEKELELNTQKQKKED